MSLRVLLPAAVLLAVSLTSATTPMLHAQEPKKVEAIKTVEAPKSDKERITGWWRETSKTVAGETTTDLGGGRKTGGWGLFTYHFHDGKASEWLEGDDTTKPAGTIYEVVIDETTNPKKLDLIKVFGEQRNVFPGIYEWDGEKLRINGAMDAAGVGKDAIEKRRPKNFKPSAKTVKRQNQLIILEKLDEK